MSREAPWEVGDAIRLTCAGTDHVIGEHTLTVERVTELTCGCTRLQMRRPGPNVSGSSPWVSVTAGTPGCYCGAERVLPLAESSPVAVAGQRRDGVTNP